MSYSKNFNIKASKCKLCEQIATITISPILSTSNKKSYDIYSHSNDIVDDIVDEIVDKVNTHTNEQVITIINSIEVTEEDIENIFDWPYIVDYVTFCDVKIYNIEENDKYGNN